MAGEHASAELVESQTPVEGVQVSYTQFGLRMPDNTTLWAPLFLRVAGEIITASETAHTEDELPLHSVDLAGVVREHERKTPGPATLQLHEELDKLALAAYMPVEEYRERVFVVQRELLLTVPEKPSTEIEATAFVKGLG